MRSLLALPVAVHRLAARVLDLVLPARCPGCGRVGMALLCPTCVASIQRQPVRRCRVCGDPAVPEGKRCNACRTARPVFQCAFAAGRYGPPLSTAILALKYHRRRSASPALAGVMAAAVPAAIGRRVDVVVPVPCHPARVRRRGIDHAVLLAGDVALALSRPWLRALERTAPTIPQVGLPAAARRANVSGAFALRADVAGQRVLLVDDVMTTGATAGACAAVLCAGGARAVWVVTAARASGSPVAQRGRGRYNARSLALKETRHGD